MFKAFLASVFHVLDYNSNLSHFAAIVGIRFLLHWERRHEMIYGCFIWYKRAWNKRLYWWTFITWHYWSLWRLNVHHHFASMHDIVIIPELALIVFEQTWLSLSMLVSLHLMYWFGVVHKAWYPVRLLLCWTIFISSTWFLSLWLKLNLRNALL